MPTSIASSGNYVVVAELRAAPTVKFEAGLAGFGTVVRLTQTVWLLQTEATLASVRNHLLTCLTPSDMLFIVDVGTGRRAWNNLGLENEARVRTIWQKTEPASA